MALVDWESFARETAALNLFSSSNWGISSDGTGPFSYGRYAWHTNGQMRRVSWFPTMNDGWWQAHLYIAQVPLGVSIDVAAWLGSTEQVQVRFGPTGTVQLRRGGSLLLDNGVAWPVGVWFFAQIRFNCLTAGGSVEVWINGKQVLAYSGNTAASGANGWNGWQVSATAGVETRVANLVIYSTAGNAPNARTPETRIWDTLPAGAGGTTEWTPSAGANWQCVDEQPSNGDTDYVSAASAPLTDTYSCPAEATAGSIIYAVAVHATARKDDAGTNEVDGVLRSAGANYANGAPAALSASYARYRWRWDTDPATGTAWTVTGANAAQPGIRRTT
jgi:hypothetical protein